MSYSFRSAGANTRRRPRATFQKTNNRGRTGERIEISRFIKPAKPVETAAYEAMHTFADFGFEQILQTNLDNKGYVTPSPIQDQAIPVGLKGQDIIGIASTGTGKTAAFALPVLQKLVTDPRSNALIIAPTRELAQQIEDECRQIAKGTGLTGVLLIGGTGMGSQLNALRHNPRIVIGTPGRIKDHLQRQTLRLNNFNLIVLDEVDRMLDMGFVNDVTEILGRLNPQRQSFFFSATMDTGVRKLIDSFTNNPVTITLKTSSASENVHQDVVRFQGTHEKLDKLHDLLNREEVQKVIVFDETQRNVERLSKELVARGFEADAIHGGKSQGQRQRALRSFKDNRVKILVATDVAARGIDVVDITHVVNYSIPKAYDDYIHRVGRAGRAGRIGYALTFVGQ